MDLVLSKGIRAAAAAAVLCSWLAATNAAVAESNSDAVRSSLATMHEWVGDGDNGKGWRAYLLSDQLDQQLTKDDAADAAPLVPVERHVALARTLRGLGFVQFVYCVATHFPEKTGAKAQPERFEVAYALRPVGKGSRVVSWRLSLAPGQSAPTLVGLFAGADWQEREQYDLVGVRFDGHPDLRRLMLPETWVGHPLRKDYAADTACPPWR